MNWSLECFFKCEPVVAESYFGFSGGSYEAQFRKLPVFLLGSKGKDFSLEWREGSTILRVLQGPSNEQAQTGSLRSYVTNQGCALMRRKDVFCIFDYSLEYLD